MCVCVRVCGRTFTLYTDRNCVTHLMAVLCVPICSSHVYTLLALVNLLLHAGRKKEVQIYQRVHTLILHSSSCFLLITDDKNISILQSAAVRRGFQLFTWKMAFTVYIREHMQIFAFDPQQIPFELHTLYAVFDVTTPKPPTRISSDYFLLPN